MCQVSSFNVDHEKCIQGCNCCKSKDSAAAVSATLAERERIVKLIENVSFMWMGDVQMIQISRDALITLIKGESNE